MSSAKVRPIRVLRLGAIGTLSFWVPDVLLHWLIRMYIGVDWFWVLTLTLPANFAAALAQWHCFCRRTPALTPDQVKARLMQSAYKNLVPYSSVTDPGTGQIYYDQADIFTVGAVT